jgi:phosphatidylglycerophosphate synthase
MIDLELRGIKDRLLNPLARAIGTAVHPTVLSLIGFAVGLGALAAAAIGLNIVALILWLVNRIIDGLDGAVARAAGKASDLGGYLDIALDFFIYAGFPLVLAIGGGAGAWPAAALLLASFYVNAALWMSASALLEKRRLNGASETESGEGPAAPACSCPGDWWKASKPSFSSA